MYYMNIDSDNPIAYMGNTNIDIGSPVNQMYYKNIDSDSPVAYMGNTNIDIGSPLTKCTTWTLTVTVQ